MNVRNVVPQLRTTDIDASLDFYTKTLGFELEFRYEDFYAGIHANGHEIHFKLVDEDDKDPGIDYVREGEHLHLFVSVTDAASFAEALKQKGVEFQKDLIETPWGTREFYVFDDQGHVLCFAQDLSSTDD